MGTSVGALELGNMSMQLGGQLGGHAGIGGAKAVGNTVLLAPPPD